MGTSFVLCPIQKLLSEVAPLSAHLAHASPDLSVPITVASLLKGFCSRPVLRVLSRQTGRFGAATGGAIYVNDFFIFFCADRVNLCPMFSPLGLEFLLCVKPCSPVPARRGPAGKVLLSGLLAMSCDLCAIMRFLWCLLRGGALRQWRNGSFLRFSRSSRRLLAWSR